ncbi:MAG: efflux RND transporter permease subunit [Bacteroidota bacterium]
MQQIIKYFIKYPIAGNLLLILIFIFGYLGLQSLRSTFFPDSDPRTINIQTVYPGASPEEVEEGIVSKIEDELRGLTGVKRVTSTSSENLGTVRVEILRGFDMDLLLQDVKNTVDRINSFPVGIEPPVIYKLESLTLAVNFAVTGDIDLKTLKSIAREVEDDLLAEPGISKVTLSGFPDEEVQIYVRENDLRRYNLTFDQVARAVQLANIELSGGSIKTDVEELLIRSRNKEYFAPEFLDIVVAQSADGRQVKLYEIAEVKDNWAEVPNRVFVNGNPAIGINVSNTTSENLLDISEIVKEYIEKFNAENDKVEALIIIDGSVTLNERIDLLTNNGIIGFVLVIILLAMFLQIRLAFWVAIAIPISLLGMFMLGPFVGLTVNAISLFGMILVIGILVDDGIVISENIYRKWEEGLPPAQAAYEGTMEVLPAVFSAILTTMVAFSTFLFLDGITGDFNSEIAIVVILSLLFSLIEGALILPGHIAHSDALIREKKEPTGIMKFFADIQNALWRFMDWLREKMYAPALRFFMDNTGVGIAIFVGLLMISMSLVPGGLVKIVFFPQIEGDFISVNLEMPAGTRENVTQKWLDHIEKGVWQTNEALKGDQPGGQDLIRIVSKTLGPNSYSGVLQINLLTAELRTYDSRAVSDTIRKYVGPIYEAEKVQYGISTPFGKAISIAVVGNNLDQLAAASEELREALEGDIELRNITSSAKEGLREIDVQLNEKAKLLGLTLQDVIGQVRQGFFGVEVQRLQRGQDEVKVWVRYDNPDRSSIGKLEDMRIRTSNGQTFPLKEIADFSLGRGVISINRIDGKREVRIEADAANERVSTQEKLAIIESEVIPEILARYPSVGYSMEGQVRQNAETGASFGKVFPIIGILMIAIIALTFRSASQTVAVLIIIPFSFIGVFGGHYLMGKPFSVIFSGLGFLALVGVLVNDALVLVSQHNNLIKEGKEFKEALYEACLSRFRPIFLTSLTTIAGLAPLILEKSFQAQFLIPMAISIAFGLAIATVVILLALPSFLILFNLYKRSMLALWQGVWPSATSVEPAFEGRKYYFLLWWLVPMVLIILMITGQSFGP